MNRLISFVFAAMLALSASAQVYDGFYRIQNYGSGRYVYVCDNTGSIDVGAQSADMAAIVLFKTPERRFSDAASVIHVVKEGESKYGYLFNLQAQGTGVREIVGINVTVTTGTRTGCYWIYEPKHSVYLWDEVLATDEMGYVGVNVVKDAAGTAKNDYKNWKVYPISSSTNEYFGLEPNSSMKVGDKYYKPFYMAYPFDFASAGMKAYYVIAIHSDAIVIREITGEVPAMTPVIVECSTAAATTNRLNFYESSVAEITDNKLEGNFFCFDGHQKSEDSHVGYDPNTMRVLAVKDGKLKYITDDKGEYTTAMNINGSAYTHFLNANESYLKVAEGVPAEIAVMTEEEYNATHVIKGDIDGNKVINNTDVTALYKLIADGKSATEAPAGDVDGNGTINIADIAALYKLISAGS